MRPYAMVKGKYADQNEIIAFIKDDIARFKKLIELDSIDKYVEIAEKMGNAYERLEHIFLHHNVDKGIVYNLNKEIDEFAAELEEIHSKSEVIKLH